MILSLGTSVRFTNPAFTLETQFQPETGITAVVGKNGAGKSTSTIEALRFLLFGHKARRGVAKDYTNYSASGTVVIADKIYHLSRSPKRDEITDESGTVLAVGAGEVTEKVEELMGYGLEVFDICNASVQKDGARFGRMTPGDRKKLIDKVVGLTSYEGVEKLCRAEAQMLRREAEALSRQLVAPEPIETWEGPTPDRDAYLRARGARREADRLQMALKNFPEPEMPDNSEPTDERIALAEVIENDPGAALYTADELAAAEDKLRRGPRPELSDEEIEAGLDAWRVFLAHEESDEVTCPSCETVFRPTGEPPAKPSHPRTYLADQAKASARWHDAPAGLKDAPDLSAGVISSQKARLSAHEAAQSAREALDGAEHPELSLGALRALKTAWRAYRQLKDQFERQSEVNEQVLLAIEELGEVPSHDEVDAMEQAVSAYEAHKHREERAWGQQESFDKLSKEISEKNTLADEFAKGAGALNEARAAIKAFIAPRLSTVASAMLRDMSQGRYNHVVIDEDMNILIDNQRLETLSGGWESVANIALRLALGQVLVAKTFPVFLGDEIDADADETNRHSVIDAMVGLKSHLKQIILITHRDVNVADHVFTIG